MRPKLHQWLSTRGWKLQSLLRNQRCRKRTRDLSRRRATAEITTATKEAVFKRILIRTHSHAVGRPITHPKPRKLLGVWTPPVCVFADPVPLGPDKETCELSRKAIV